MSYRNFTKNTSGAATPMFLFFTVIFLVFGGIAIDTSNAYRMRTAMQATADAAATAAAKELVNGPDAARAAALDYVELNLPKAKYGDLTKAIDIAVGNWDVDSKVFDPTGTPANAIKVKLVRAESRNNPLKTHLLGVAGISSWDIGTNAVALLSGGFSCTGIIAETYVKMGQDVRIQDGVCVFGRDKITFGQDPYVSEGAAIGTVPDPINLVTGQDPKIYGEKFSDPDLHATRAINIKATIDGWEVGAPIPFGPTYTVRVVSRLPRNLVSQSVYIVNGNVNIGQDYHVTDVVIAVRGKVTFGQDGRLRNTQDCVTGNAIGLFATGQIEFGQDAHLTGVDIIAGTNIVMGQDVRAFRASMEANGHITMAQDPHFDTCLPLQVDPNAAPKGSILALVQ